MSRVPRGGDRRRLVVVGAGITGLAAAWEASKDPSVEVTVLEAERRTGGKIRTTELETSGPTPIDEGPDNFLARTPQAVELCEELGIGDQLVEPAASRARVWIDHTPVDMPGGTMLGVPYDFDAVAATGILSPEGLARARQEPDRKWSAPSSDVSIGAFLGERYGDEVVERLVSPLVGGINAGNVHRLSLAAVTPQLWAAARAGGSLSTTLARAAEKMARARATAPKGVFRGLSGGTATLTDTLHRRLVERGVTITTGTTLHAISRVDGLWRLDTTGTTGTTGRSTDGGVSSSEPMTADAVIVAVPIREAARIVDGPSPDVAAMMRTIRSASVAMTTFVYPSGSFPDVDASVSGILVPRGAGLATTAISFGSHKWPHWSGSRADTDPDRTPDHAMVHPEAMPPEVLRVSAGHMDDPRSAALPDDELVERLTEEISMLTGSSAVPLRFRITRWRDAFPQYAPGHLELVDEMTAELARVAPTLRLAGASYRGLGIPACIESGRSAVRELLG